MLNLNKTWGKKFPWPSWSGSRRSTDEDLSQSRFEKYKGHKSFYQDKDYKSKSAKYMAVKELIAKGELPEDTLQNTTFIDSLFTRDYNLLDLGHIKIKRFLDRWSEAEKVRWSQAVLEHGRDFEAITKAMGGAKSFSQCMSRAAQFLNKFRMAQANQGWNKLGEYIGRDNLTQTDLEVYEILQLPNQTPRKKYRSVSS